MPIGIVLRLKTTAIPKSFGESELSLNRTKQITRIEFVRLLHRAARHLHQLFCGYPTSQSILTMSTPTFPAHPSLYDLVTAGVVESRRQTSTPTLR
jgi:hypothetical protein